MVGFGCNVPAISATRILGDARQRVLTALLVPFTSCTARLTVYVMVGTIFFRGVAGTVVFVMYLASILFVIGVGFALRKTLWRTMGSEPLVLDLPPYQTPTLRLTAAVTWSRLQGFLRTASGIIVLTVCIVWFLQSLPAQPGQQFGEVPVQDSAYAAAAQAVAPVFEPAGFGEWQTVSALVVGFVAKEAVISSWAQTYAVAEPGDGEDPRQPRHGHQRRLRQLLRGGTRCGGLGVPRVPHGLHAVRRHRRRPEARDRPAVDPVRHRGPAGRRMERRRARLPGGRLFW